MKTKEERNAGKSIKNMLLFAILVVLTAIVLSNNAYSARDFIVENRTAALFIVNGTTGNIIMAPSFGNVGIGD